MSVEAAPECQRCPVKGACCKFVLVQLARPMSGDGIRWLQLHPGLTYHEIHGEPCLKIAVKCSALDQNNDCVLIGSRDRPRMCGTWPEPPDLVAWLDEKMPDDDHDQCVFIQEAREAAAVPGPLELTTCPDCGGHGEVAYTGAADNMDVYTETCDRCGGAGIIDKQDDDEWD